MKIKINKLFGRYDNVIDFDKKIIFLLAKMVLVNLLQLKCFASVDLLFLDINLNYILLYLQVLTNYLFLFLFFSSRFDTTRCLSHSFSNNIKSGQICLFANRSSLHIILCSSCAKRRISFPCRRHHFNSCLHLRLYES